MGTHSEHIGGALADARWRRGKYDEVMIQLAVATEFPLAANMPPTIALSGPTGGYVVLMPPDSADIKGLELTIINLNTTGTMTLETSASAALTPAVTNAANAAVTMVHLGGTGTTGWRRKDQ